MPTFHYHGDSGAGGWTMPFGKHRGEPLGDIPLDYLDWVLENCELRSERLREAIEEEVERRSHGQHDSPPRPGPERSGTNADKEELKSIVRSWYRKLAAQFHHDRGNDQNIMRAINIARDDLLKALKIDNY